MSSAASLAMRRLQRGQARLAVALSRSSSPTSPEVGRLVDDIHHAREIVDRRGASRSAGYAATLPPYGTLGVHAGLAALGLAALMFVIAVLVTHLGGS